MAAVYNQTGKPCEYITDECKSPTVRESFDSRGHISMKSTVS